MKKTDAIIIGSGIAGLAAAVRLRMQGFQVKVFEKNEYPGGKISSFRQDGFHFDAGPSLFTSPEEIEELFQLAGENIEDYFQYQPVDIACQYFFPNGKTIHAYAEPEKFAEELAGAGESKTKVLKYLGASNKLYNSTGSIFMDHSLHKRKTWLNKHIGKALLSLRPAYLFSTLDNYNRRRFSTPEAVQIFNRFATYNGSSPYKAPGMLSVIPHLEHNKGVFYPVGGMISIANALFRLAKKKEIIFHFNTPVQAIIHHEQRAMGIVVNDENIFADVVVSNVDAYFTYSQLLKHTHKAKRIRKQERSSSALIFYWGINRSFEALGLHNIFFTEDYKKEFENIFRHETISEDPTIYINITSKADKAHAPAGAENWFVMVNVPANNGQDWNELKNKTRVSVINKLNRMLDTDLEPLIISEQTLDPVLLEARTGSFQGALYGPSSNSKLSAFFRHPNFTNYIRGLYFCGGSVHPGGGLPLCFKSAKIVSGLIKTDKTLQRRHH